MNTHRGNRAKYIERYAEKETDNQTTASIGAIDPRKAVYLSILPLLAECGTQCTQAEVDEFIVPGEKGLVFNWASFCAKNRASV